MTYDEFKVVVAKVIEIEYYHWLKHGTPIRKEDAVLVADDVAGEVFIDSAVELARLRAEIDRLRGLLRDTLERIEVLADPNRVNAHLAVLVELTASRAKIRAALAGATDQPKAGVTTCGECGATDRHYSICSKASQRVAFLPTDQPSPQSPVEGMKDATRQAAQELIRSAAAMRETANMLYWAYHPGEECAAGPAPSVQDAQEQHATAFRSLHRAEYYMEKALAAEATAVQPSPALDLNAPFDAPLRMEEIRRKQRDEQENELAREFMASPEFAEMVRRAYGKAVFAKVAESVVMGATDNGHPATVKHTRMCATWSVIDGLPCTCGAVPNSKQGGT